MPDLPNLNDSQDHSSPAIAQPREGGSERTRQGATLMEAFNLGDELDNERAIRAVELLLDWASDAGSEPVDGMLALGLAKALRLAADRVALDRRRECRLRAAS